MTWDEYFLELAATAAKKSKDPNCQVGVAIRGARNDTVATGFNGLPIGLSDRVVHDREKKLGRILHAEVNAFIFADPRKLAGATVYTTKPVCHHCAPVICQYHGLYGPLNIVQPPIDEASSWAESQKAALEMFTAVGVQVRQATLARNLGGPALQVMKACYTCRHFEGGPPCGTCTLGARKGWEPKQ